MLDLQREHGLTYLFISHDRSVVRYLPDTIGVLYLGTLVEVGPAWDVYSAPVHPYTRGLTDVVPVGGPFTAEGHLAACHFPLGDPVPALAAASRPGPAG
jgi:peptide/nickel transport system ATP-binding protein